MAVFNIDERFKDIQSVVATYYSISPLLLEQPGGGRTAGTAKQILRYFAYHFLTRDGLYYKSVRTTKAKIDMTMKDIANLSGGQTHSTTSISKITVEDKIKKDPVFKKTVEIIKNLIYTRVNFGSYQVVDSVVDYDTRMKLLVDKKGNKFFEIETREMNAIVSDVEFVSIMKLRNLLAKQNGEKKIYY